MKKLFVVLVSLCIVTTTFGQKTKETILLEKRSEEFRDEIIKISDNIYVASGYDASNITMIEGEDGIILIDAGMIPAITSQIYKDFRRITQKPIKGIIITHGHGDHTNGISPFLGDEGVQIWAAENFGSENNFSKEGGFINPRQHHQSGMKLSPDKRINNGIAPSVYPGGSFKKSQLSSNGHLFIPFDKNKITNFVTKQVETITIAGITLELHRADGETSDHLVVWYPAKGILFPGDLYYKSFPNLYAIRGTAYRDVNKWIESLDMMLTFDAKTMAQGHTRPIVGASNVKTALTNYRDAIAHVFNTTIEGMNKGLTPDELVEYVSLPEHLKNDPNLVQYYGRIEWAVRNIYNGYLGWFDGNPTNLRPLSPKQEAEEMAELLGGVEEIEKIARKALKEKKCQWAAELSDRLLAIDNTNMSYRELKATALEQLALHVETAIARNYYNSVAQDLRKE